MPRPVLVLPAMLILGMALPVSPASGDPIQILGGSITLVGQFTAENVAEIQGTQGFRGQFIPGGVGGQWVCQPCGPPGTPISLNAFLDTVDGSGTVELGGITYPVGSTFPESGFAVLSLTLLGGPVVLPPLAQRATLTAPFEPGRFSQLFFDVGAAADVPQSGRRIDEVLNACYPVFLPGSHSRVTISMAVIFRLPAVPPEFDARLREAAEDVLQGEWRITVLRSHYDGQWNLQLEGPHTRCRIVISSLEKVTVAGMTLILRQLAEPHDGPRSHSVGTPPEGAGPSNESGVALP